VSAGPDPAVTPVAAPPSWRERLAPVRELFTTRAGVAAAGLVLGVVLGLVVADALHEDAYHRARRAVDTQLLPMAVDADGIWTSSDARASVSDALIALRNDDPRPVDRHLDEWLDAYDTAIIKIAGQSLPPSARPVQRQVIAGLTLSRDAVELLGRAAEVGRATGQQAPDLRASHREDLLIEVARLRQRSEQLLQGARAATGDLVGDPSVVRPDVGPLPSVTEFPSPPA
jgi:hypothetical protein